MKRDVNIQLLRIFSMFLILMCHFCNEMGNKWGSILGQVFNVGVFIFLFISGYLFGKKEIKDIKNWYFKRAIRIFVPLWIWTVVVNVLYLVVGKPELVNVKSIIAYVFNLQGFFGITQGLEHLWFLTLIMICYLITPLLQKFRNVKMTKIICSIIVLAIASVGVAFIDIKIGRYIFECLLYVFAYFYSYKYKEKIGQKFPNIYIYAFVSILISIAIRFMGQKLFDNTVLYSNVIVLLTQSIIAVCTFVIFKQLKLNIKSNRATTVINHIDKVSFYMYIVHYIFCVGPVDIIGNFGAMWFIQIGGVFVIAYALASVLSSINDFIVKKISGV